MSEVEGIQEKSQLPGIRQALQAVKERIRKGVNGAIEHPDSSTAPAGVDPAFTAEIEAKAKRPRKPKDGAAVKAEVTSRVVKRKPNPRAGEKAEVEAVQLIAPSEGSAETITLLDDTEVPPETVSAPVKPARKRAVAKGKPRTIGALTLSSFNPHERLVLQALWAQKEPLTIRVLSEICFADKQEARTSYVRNALRRLVRDGAIEQVGRGTYRLSVGGKTLYS